MKFFHSLRWRLQLWHGLLLTVVLAGFGFTAWQLQRATQFQRVEQELEQHISVIAGAMRRAGGLADRLQLGESGGGRREAGERPGFGNRPPPQDRPPRDRLPQERPPLDRLLLEDRPGFGNLPPPRLELRLSARDLSLFEGSPSNSFYYVVWHRDDREGSRSTNAPSDMPRPGRVDKSRDSRLRGTLLERMHFTPTGECILVGRNIRDELAGTRRFAWLLASAGSVVLALGLVGGWWISSRAIRPITDISATAVKISGTDLSQRIHTADTDSELGQLAGVLNDTFARLQTAFERQVQFTADASHELRTPVSVVLTQTQSALSRERSAEEYRESLAACQRSAQRMRQLIESLLTLARLDSGETEIPPEPCELDRITRDAVELLRPLAEEQGVKLELNLAPTRCLGKNGQLAQVVSNLVSNAIYYNRPGGSVQVKVAAEPDKAILSVQDTGQGIATEDLSHIFERFYRADKARARANDHSGLGLSITQAIVTGHGGTIEVSSEPGKGSAFIVRLPAPSKVVEPGA
jgi:heavy metal sensor kinase